MDTTLADPLVGRVLDGRYRIQDRIARGGMATVYRAVDTRLDRLVAVKVMHPVLADNDEFVAKFTREAKSAARLSHPNVVAVFDQGSDHGVVFLVMEYVDGATLRDLIRERGRLSPRQALDVLAPILSALEAAHQAGIVHRDIKPENVLISADGRIKVADFGLARAIAASHLTATTGLLIGTAAYLAPEQIEHGVADPRTDIYAAGIVLYELLTGRPPYEGATPMVVVFKHVHEQVPPPSAVRPDVPRSLDALVLDATQRDPDDRPPTAGELLEQLEAAARTLPAEPLDLTQRTQVLGTHLTTVLSSAPPVGPAQTLVAPPEWPPPQSTVTGQPRPPRRHRRGWLHGWRLAVLLLVIVTVLAAAAGAYLGMRNQSSSSPPAPQTGQPTTAAAPTTGAVQLTALPDFRGDSQSVATSLAGSNLTIAIAPTRVPSDTIAAGSVVSQQPPAPGPDVTIGTTVTLTLSSGPQTYAVPTTLVGMSLPAAKTALVAAHLTLGSHSSQHDPTVAQGDVISLAAGTPTALPSGTPVDVVLSSGPAPIAINDEHGKSAAAAVSDLKGQGFTTVTTNPVYSNTVTNGLVVSTTPAFPANVKPGGAIVVDVSQGPQLFKVPDLYAQTVTQAENLLAAVGMQAHVIREISPTGGHVLTQSPSAGALDPAGTVVTIKIF